MLRAEVGEGGIQTARLLLVPFSLRLVQAAIGNRDALQKLLGVSVPDEWPGPDIQEVLPLFARLLQADPARAEWGRLILHKRDRMLIGDIGFKDLPDQHGSVEIGYSVIPSHRGRGYATEAARGMVRWAFRQPGVGRVIAECLSDNRASIRVLEKLGMVRLREENGMLKWAITDEGRACDK